MATLPEMTKPLGEILDLMPDPLLLRRWEDEEVIYANRPFADLVGRPVEDIVGRTLNELNLSFRQEDRNEYLETLEEDGVARNFPLRVEPTGNGDGRHVHLLSSKRLEYDGDDCVLSVAKDITERETAKERLERAERRYRALFHRNVAGTFRTRPDGEILECNQAFAEMLGYESPDQLTGEDAAKLYYAPEERQERIRRLQKEPLSASELKLIQRDGSPIWVLENSFLIEDPELGEPVNMGTLVDITEERKLRDRLRHRAHHDELTGLLNRRALFDRAEQALAICARQSQKAAVVYADISGFQQVNEQLGHQGGDEVLRAIGERLQEEMRDSDLVARIGGDEFVVIATQIKKEEDVDQVGRRVMLAFDEPFETEHTSLQLRPAVGIAVYPEDGRDLDPLLHRADDALWGPDRNKSPGIRRFQVEELDEGVPTWEVTKQLKRALQRGSELYQVYHPIMSADGRDLVGVEALVRWQHPEHGLVTPDQFIPEAEASGLIRQLDRIVFRTVVAQAAKWTREGHPPDWLAVNLSAQTLSNPEFVEWVRQTLADCPTISPKQVVIEITEHTAIRQVARSEVLDQLENDIGISISIDDFGIGYSSLLYLRQFPADYLKIDRQFVAGVSQSEPDQKVVKGIIELGNAFGMKIIAEGVETEEEEGWLRQAGCQYLQGFLFGRPVSAEEIEQRLI